jgi:hypothetical protein
MLRDDGREMNGFFVREHFAMILLRPLLNTVLRTTAIAWCVQKNALP